MSQARIAPVALALIVAAILASSAAVTAAEPVLSTEARLEDLARAIEEFWSARGRMGSLERKGQPTIAYATFMQEDRRREAGAIVVSSGRTESYVKYKELVYDLWNNGYSVYIHDHRGQGFSDREPAIQNGCSDGEPERDSKKTRDDCQKGHVDKFTSFVDDLEYFVETRVIPGKHANLFLLAHSMGGAIASLYLERDAMRVAQANKKAKPGRPRARPIFRTAAMTSPMHRISGIAGYPTTVFSCKVAAVEASMRPAAFAYEQGGYRPRDFAENQYTTSALRYDRLTAVFGEKDSKRAQLGGTTWGWIHQACRASDRAVIQAHLIDVPVRLFQAAGDDIVHPSGHVQFCALLARGKANEKVGCGGDAGGPIVIGWHEDERSRARHELLIESDAHRNEVLKQVLDFFGSHRNRSRSTGEIADEKDL